MKAIPVLMALASTGATSVASASVVLDQFRCLIELRDHKGEPGLKSWTDAQVLRVPMATDPLWVPGTTATTGHLTATVEDARTGLFVDLNLDYQLYLAPNANHAGQFTCTSYSYLQKKGPSSEILCPTFAYHDPDASGHVDPLLSIQPVSVDTSGMPEFRAQDLDHFTLHLGGDVWQEAQVGCSYLGTTVIGTQKGA